MRYIDADELLNQYPEEFEKIFEVIGEEPTVDPVKHAHWIEVKGKDIYGEPYKFYKCSKCQSKSITPFSGYCPWCGAKMD